jgi:autotransporter-associated beta strand protein
MNRKNKPFAALTCASLLGSAALSQAALLVSEDFSYGDSGLNGQSGGTGFSTAWNSSTNVTGGVVTGNDPSTRDLSAAFPSSGTLWVSFDWGNSGQPSQNNSYGGLTFYIGGSEKFLIGNTWPHPASHAVWQMNGASPTSVPNYPGMQTAVAKITLGAGATSTVELWVGPTGSPVDVSGPPLITSTGRELEGVNRLRINGGDFGGGGNTQSFDNLLIGTTVADVDATDTPPVLTTATWTNPAGGPWDTTGNWLDNTVGIGSGNTADFNTLDITADTTVNLDSPRTIGNLVFGDTDTATAAGWTLANNETPGNTLTLAGTTPTLTVNALGVSEAVEISAVVAGTTGLTKSGPGSLVLSGANTYSGTTTVGNGTLQISGQPYFNIGRTTSIASGAVFDLSNSNNTFASLMPSSTITGAGTFRLSGNSTLNQDLNGVSGTRLTIAMLSGGLIDLQDSSRLTNGGWQELNWSGNLADMNIASGATLDVWDGQDVIIDALTGSGTVDKLHTGNSPRLLKVGVDNGSGTFSGTITNATGGQLAFTKAGSGTQTLSGTNTYTGNTTVEDGTLSIAPGGSLRFFPITNGQTNSLSGSATATLSYLGTLDLDLSAADTTDGNSWTLVNVASFSGPVPTLEPAAVTSTLGAFGEVSPGTWELSSPSDKWTFTEADGFLIYEVTATDYEIWGAPYGLGSGSEGGDLDNDGLTNFEEYAFGLIPDSGASVNAITALLDKSTGTFIYTRRTDSGLAYSVWFSTDLAVWTEDTSATEGVPVPSGDNESVEVTLSTLPGDPLPAKLFIQVRAD